MHSPIHRFLILLSLFFCSCSIFAEEDSFFQDMLIVNYWDRKINERLPVTYDHLLRGGYFSMPSARMGEEGEIGIGMAWVPPYHQYNLRLQLIDRLEVTGSYRVFRGVEDPILSPLGFGDMSDKGVNIKISLFSPEDSGYDLPGVAIGLDDFVGTKSFQAYYAVITKVFLDYDLEFSLGIGTKRIHGVFGGFAWHPFRMCSYPWLQGLSFSAEYDAIPYDDPNAEPHPKGRTKHTPFNFGLKYRFWDCFDLSVAYIRGDAIAASASVYYNLGNTQGILPKIDNSLPYIAPMNLEPIGVRRPEEVLAQDLLYALRDQGFDLLEASLNRTECEETVLYLDIVNRQYLMEYDVRIRLNHLLAALIPDHIDEVVVVIESEGFPIQEYHYYMEHLRSYRLKEIGPYELSVLTPLCDVPLAKRSFFYTQQLFKQNRNRWNIELLPKTLTLFGSSRGKFKYALGLNLGLNGYLYDSLYYSIRLGWIMFSDLKHVSGVDRLNPSQLINVRTDIVEYYKTNRVTVDEMYLQRSWDLGSGLYTRFALGLFEEEYGGAAAEILYYPVASNWAVGLEGAVLRKRTTTGMGFTDRIRQLDGFIPTFHKFRGSQYFLDLYYNWREACLDFKVMAGKFLANDKGARFEITRYFPSGLRIFLWYTVTDGHDKINGSTYYDKGLGFSMPLDIFYTYSDRSRWGYGMSAWLRDVGVKAETGLRLYPLIREERN